MALVKNRINGAHKLSSRHKGSVKRRGVKLRPRPSLLTQGSVVSASPLVAAASDSDGPEEEEGKPLVNLTICVTGCQSSRVDLYDIARDLGATVEESLTSSTTHLIAEAPGSLKYQMALKNRKYVMLPSWLPAVREAYVSGEDMDLKALLVQHRMPPLYGLRIHTTHPQVLDEIQRHGAELVESPTHEADYTIATIANGKQAVWPNWIPDVIRHKGVLPEVDERWRVTEGKEEPAFPSETFLIPLNTRVENDDDDDEIIFVAPKKTKTLTARMELSAIDELLGTYQTATTQRSVPPRKTEGSINRQSSLLRTLSTAKSESSKTNTRVSSKLFSGLTFSMSGLDVPTYRVVKDAVESNDGELVVDSSINYEVVPYFKSNHLPLSVQPRDHKVVTPAWIEHCLYEGKVLDEVPSCVLCTPLPFSVPVSEAEKWDVHLTGYDDIERVHVSRLVRAMGGTVSSTFSSERTHLVTDKPTHDDGTSRANLALKIRKSREWNIPIVDSKWIIAFGTSRASRAPSIYTEEAQLAKLASPVRSVSRVPSSYPEAERLEMSNDLEGMTKTTTTFLPEAQMPASNYNHLADSTGTGTGTGDSSILTTTIENESATTNSELGVTANGIERLPAAQPPGIPEPESPYNRSLLKGKTSSLLARFESLQDSSNVFASVGAAGRRRNRHQHKLPRNALSNKSSSELLSIEQQEAHQANSKVLLDGHSAVSSLSQIVQSQHEDDAMYLTYENMSQQRARKKILDALSGNGSHTSEPVEQTIPPRMEDDTSRYSKRLRTRN